MFLEVIQIKKKILKKSKRLKLLGYPLKEMKILLIIDTVNIVIKSLKTQVNWIGTCVFIKNLKNIAANIKIANQNSPEKNILIHTEIFMKILNHLNAMVIMINLFCLKTSILKVVLDYRTNKKDVKFKLKIVNRNSNIKKT